MNECITNEEIIKNLIDGDRERVARLNGVSKRYVDIVLHNRRPAKSEKAKEILLDLQNIATLNIIVDNMKEEKLQAA